MSELSKYQQGTANWRAVIRKNNRNTRRVIFFFILLYITVGLLTDILIHYEPQWGVWFTAKALLLWYIPPYATLFFCGVGLLSVLVAYRLHDKIVLFGTQYHEITRDNKNTIVEQQLYNVVEEMKLSAGLNFMPRVFIIQADYMNAFASGYSEKSAMVAITRGLLEKLNRAELTAVMAHELSHIRHMDIKITLMVSVLANLMVMLIDVLFYGVLYGRGGRRANNPALLVIIILRYLLPFITVLLSFYLSRTREYMADAGCVELMRDNGPMASALIKIHQDHVANAKVYHEAYQKTSHEGVRRAAYIYDPVKSGVMSLHSITGMFRTHPTLEQRLEAIGFKKHDDD